MKLPEVTKLPVFGVTCNEVTLTKNEVTCFSFLQFIEN